VLVLTAHILTVADHHDDIDGDSNAGLVAEAVAFLARAAAQPSGQPVFGRMHAAFAELSCRARIARARFALGPTVPEPAAASVVWFETEARRSAGHSARVLIEAFTRAEEKPLETRLWRPIDW